MSGDLIVSGQRWQALRDQCHLLVRSGFLPQAVNTPEKALAIALKGHEINVPPMQAFSQINVIQGKPAISAELQLALIYRNVPGAKVEFERLDKDGCAILAQRPGHRPVKITFDKADAAAAGLLEKDIWKKYPRAMYRSRAIAETARTVFPDAIMGCSYTPEELGASVNEEGEVLDIPSELPETPPQPQSGYDGSTEHRKGLRKALKERNIDESFWEDIHKAMMGKTSSELDATIREATSQ